jgi:glycosyltransferase involved in cell wall biosynthesis
MFRWQGETQSIPIQWLRSLSHEAVYEQVGEASLLVLPSGCYENFPRVVIEAFAKGTPAIVSKLGAMPEIVDDGRTALHFKPEESGRPC